MLAQLANCWEMGTRAVGAGTKHGKTQSLPQLMMLLRDIQQGLSEYRERKDRSSLAHHQVPGRDSTELATDCSLR